MKSREAFTVGVSGLLFTIGSYVGSTAMMEALTNNPSTEEVLADVEDCKNNVFTDQVRVIQELPEECTRVFNVLPLTVRSDQRELDEDTQVVGFSEGQPSIEPTDFELQPRHAFASNDELARLHEDYLRDDREDNNTIAKFMTGFGALIGVMHGFSTVSSKKRNKQRKHQSAKRYADEWIESIKPVEQIA